MRRPAPYLIVGLAFGLALAAHLGGLWEAVDVDALLTRRDEIRAWTDLHPVGAALAFAALYVVLMSVALPAGGVLGLAAGFLFGRWLGTGLVVAAGACAALLVFTVARSTIGDGLRRRAGPVYARIEAAMGAHAFPYLLFLRIVPIFPFFVVNVVAAVLPVRAATFLAATLVGKVPSAVIYTWLGQEIGRAASFDAALSQESLAGLAGLGLLALLPVAIRRLRDRAERRRNAKSNWHDASKVG